MLINISTSAEGSIRGIKSAAFYKEHIKTLTSDIATTAAKLKTVKGREKQYRWMHSLRERKQELVDSYKVAMKKKDHNAMDKIHKQIKAFYAKNAGDIKKMENLGKYLDIVPKARAIIVHLTKLQTQRKAKLAAYKERLKVRLEYDAKKKSAVKSVKPKAKPTSKK